MEFCSHLSEPFKTVDGASVCLTFSTKSTKLSLFWGAFLTSSRYFNGRMTGGRLSSTKLRIKKWLSSLQIL